MASGGRQNADDVLVLALACGATVESAAQKAGISPRTVHRRLTCPAFRQQLSRVRADMVQRAASLLTAAAMEAIKTLMDLQQASTPAAVRLGAARAILELGTKLREASEWEARLAALEQRMANGAANVV
jgi:hypothetical protein